MKKLNKTSFSFMPKQGMKNENENWFFPMASRLLYSTTATPSLIVITENC